MKRRLIALTTALLLVLPLAGCGAASKEETMAYAPAASAPAMDAVTTTESNSYGAEMYYEAEPSAMESPAPVSGQKLIRRASLEMETTDFEATNAAVEDLVTKMGGYMETSDLRNSRSGYRYANYTIRIPTAQFTEFLNQAGDLCHETWRSVSQEDISEVYYDTQGRLNTQQIKLERLQELLKKAETMEDIITIESAISETEQQIDNLSGTLRHYDGKVDYATVELSLSEVYKYSNVEEVPDSFASRLSNSFSRGWSSFVDSLEDLAVSLAYSWMWVLIWVVIILAALRVVRRKVRIRRKDKAEKESDKADKT